MTNGVGSEMRIPLHRPMTNGLWYLENVNTELVAEPGSTVSFYVNGISSSDYGGYNVDVRGFYISAH